MRYNLGLIAKEQGADNGFGILFPDFPNCVSANGALDGALTISRKRSKAISRRWSNPGEPIPEPSNADGVMVISADSISPSSRS